MGATASDTRGATPPLELLDLLKKHAKDRRDIFERALTNFRDEYLKKNLNDWEREIETDYLKSAARELRLLAAAVTTLAEDIEKTNPQVTVDVDVRKEGEAEPLISMDVFLRPSPRAFGLAVEKWTKETLNTKAHEKVTATETDPNKFDVVISERKESDTIDIILQNPMGERMRINVPQSGGLVSSNNMIVAASRVFGPGSLVLKGKAVKPDAKIASKEILGEPVVYFIPNKNPDGSRPRYAPEYK